jgi:hypothetical protein
MVLVLYSGNISHSRNWGHVSEAPRIQKHRVTMELAPRPIPVRAAVKTHEAATRNAQWKGTSICKIQACHSSGFVSRMES